MSRAGSRLPTLSGLRAWRALAFLAFGLPSVMVLAAALFA